MQTRNANATTNCDYLDQTVLQSVIIAIKGSRLTPRAPDLSTIAGTGIKQTLNLNNLAMATNQTWGMHLPIGTLTKE